MNFLYEIFDWTWHLSNFGEFLWAIFMAIWALWYLFGMIFFLADDDSDKDTWSRAILRIGIYYLTPPSLILAVGYIGYLINEVGGRL